jgi:hypothetical protein
MREEIVQFGAEASLIGILTRPPGAKHACELPGVILLNAGLVHRVGPNRIYVDMARNLADLGFWVLRFDFSGIGDSVVRRDHLPFDRSAVLETREAMDHMRATSGVDRFILMGICSGAEVSYRTACRDERVVGAVLINPRDHLHDRSDRQLASFLKNRAMARHYWRLALFSSFGARNLLRALRGAVDHRRIIPAMLSAPWWVLRARGQGVSSAAGCVRENLHQLAERGVRLLHVYLEGDEGLDYFQLIVRKWLREWSALGLLEVRVIPGANHTFTLRWSQEHLLHLVQDWLHEVIRKRPSTKRLPE